MAIQSTSVTTLDVHFRYQRAKRLLDIIFVLLISLFVLLVSAFVAVLILFDSKGPILYRQKRIGQNGVEFEMLKFRSMYVNNDDAAHREAVKQYMNGETLNNETLNGENATPFKLSNDPRVTRVGRIIRKLSIDELPQFWNVLCGEMSLVGPRPPLPYEAELYTMRDQLRLSGKPGLTGTWQVYGRSKVTFQEMIDMDIAYLQRQSLWLDIKLIALTVPVMVQGRGAA